MTDDYSTGDGLSPLGSRPVVRWFFAHARSDDERVAAEWAEEARQQLQDYADFLALSGESDPVRVEVVLGRDDFANWAHLAGGWEAWAEGVVSREDENGRPYYAGIIVPVSKQRGCVVGKPTFEMCDGFRRSGRYTYVYDLGSGRFSPISQLVRLSDDYRQWGEARPLLNLE